MAEFDIFTLGIFIKHKLFISEVWSKQKDVLSKSPRQTKNDKLSQ